MALEGGLTFDDDVGGAGGAAGGVAEGAGVTAGVQVSDLAQRQRDAALVTTGHCSLVDHQSDAVPEPLDFRVRKASCGERRCLSLNAAMTTSKHRTMAMMAQVSPDSTL